MLKAMQSLAEREPEFAARVKRQAELFRDMAIWEPESLRRELERLHAVPGLSRLPAELRERLVEVPPESSQDFP